MNALSDERLSRPSASSMERYMACAGAWRLEQAAAAQKVIPEGKGESAAASQGTLLHEANETGDTTDLKYSEEEMVKLIRQREEEITRNWCADFDLDFNLLEIIRERRFWFNDKNGNATSAKIDTLIIGNGGRSTGSECLIIDAKGGRKAVTPPVRNWQLRVGAAAVRCELSFSNVRVAIANVFGALQAPCDYNLADLLQIEKLLTAKLQEIEQSDLPVTAGPHCLYCPAKHICPAQREQMSVVIRQRSLNWDLVKREEKRPLFIAAKMAVDAGKAILDQIKADITADLESCPGLVKAKDGSTRKITETSKAFDALAIEFIRPDDSLLINQFLEKCSISLENFTTFYRDKTGASKEQAEKFIAEKCQDFITVSPRSGSVSIEK